MIGKVLLHLTYWWYSIINYFATIAYTGNQLLSFLKILQLKVDIKDNEFDPKYKSQNVDLS